MRETAEHPDDPPPPDPERAPWPLFAWLLADPQARARIDAAHDAAQPGAEDARALQLRLAVLRQAGIL